MAVSGTNLTFLAFILALSLSAGSRILLVPFPMHSHVSELAHIGQELVKNGHELYIILPPSYGSEKIQKFKLNYDITVLSHHMLEEDWLTLYMEGSDEGEEFLEQVLHMTFLEDLRSNVDPYVPGFTAVCTNPLSDENLYEQCKELKFDLAIIDAFVNMRCMFALLYRLGIPYVSLSTQYEPWLWKAPALPSFVPFPLGTVHTQEMDFWERLTNLFYMIDWFASPRVRYLEDWFVSKYAPEKPFVTLNYLTSRSLLFLLDTDIVLDYPRPSMPNVIEIGGSTTSALTKPLPPDLEQFVSSAPAGVIVVSFGSFGGSLPKYIREKMMGAFRQIKQRVIWRHMGEQPEDVPDNVKLLKWLPQVDLLAHHNTKLFITHCGTNGQFEGLYHAVPMIGFPIFGDQMYNSIRIQSKGFGLAMDMLTFTSDELTDNIENIIEDPSYYEHIKKASDIFKDRPDTPTQRAVYWIEHVMKYGGDYMHSRGLDIPWYEYCMLDLLAFILGVLVVAAFLFYRLISILCYCCTNATKEKLS